MYQYHLLPIGIKSSYYENNVDYPQRIVTNINPGKNCNIVTYIHSLDLVFTKAYIRKSTSYIRRKIVDSLIHQYDEQQFGNTCV